MDRLKEALEALGLKCGGTLEQRADRLFSVKGKEPEDIDNKLRVSLRSGEAEMFLVCHLQEAAQRRSRRSVKPQLILGSTGSQQGYKYRVTLMRRHHSWDLVCRVPQLELIFTSVAGVG